MTAKPLPQLFSTQRRMLKHTEVLLDSEEIKARSELRQTMVLPNNALEINEETQILPLKPWHKRSNVPLKLEHDST